LHCDNSTQEAFRLTTEHAVSRFWLILIGIVVAAFALPALVSTVEGLIPALLAGTVLIGVGMLLYRRGRRW
jgi:hypothetical protein